MKDLKTYKAIYSKSDMVIVDFEAENFDDAQGIAELKRPEGYETECVHQTAKGILKPLLDDIAKICNPNDTTYFCDHCNKDILAMKVEWKNDTSICPECGNVINL